MQSSIEGSVAKSPYSLLRHQSYYLGTNKIGSEGCRHLLKGQWNQLHKVNLGMIGGIEGRTISELKDAAICRRVSGKTSIH